MLEKEKIVSLIFVILEILKAVTIKFKT